ncbi:MAG: HD domain-containing protein, partial [Clostridia bacterium]
MTKAANRYIHAIIVLGALLLPYCLYRVIGDLNAANLATELLQMGCLVAICAVCRSLPIYITPHHAIDVSILAIITAVLLRGPYQAVIVYLLSSLCSVDLETGGEKKAHLYNTPIKKSAFNNANLLLSILIPGLLIQACGHVAGDVHLPWVLVPMVLFTVTSFLMNSAILFGMFYLNGDITGQDAREAVKGLIPNVIAAMPMGLLTCYVFTQEGGYWVALIMLLPLMLARHAWKLYLDSQNQHLSLIQAFVATVEAKDKYTEGHSRRVSKYAEMIAAQMGLSPSEIQDIRVAALLHDIGRAAEMRDPSLCHARVGSQMAHEFLLARGDQADVAQRVADCIRTHRYKNGVPPQSPEARILFDADKLDLIGTVGVARAILFGGQIDEPLYLLDEQKDPTEGLPSEGASLFREYN